MNLQLFAAGGTLITRLYDFIDGMRIGELHLDGELDRIHSWLNGKIGDVNIASDADIVGSKFKINSIPTDKVVGGVYTKFEIDAKFAAVNLVGVADRTVPAVKLVAGSVTSAEVDPTTVVTMDELRKQMKWMWINL